MGAPKSQSRMDFKLFAAMQGRLCDFVKEFDRCRIREITSRRLLREPPEVRSPVRMESNCG